MITDYTVEVTDHQKFSPLFPYTPGEHQLPHQISS